MKKTFAAAVVAAALVLVLEGAYAFTVIDPTNLVQNVISARQAVLTVENEIRQLTMLGKQYENLTRQVQGIGSDVLARNTATTLGVHEVANLANLLRATQVLRGDLASIQKSFDTRLQEAQIMGVSWEGYVAAENRRIGNNNEAAVARVRAEQHALDRVNKDYEFVREQADKIPESSGVHASMQQLNVQMNRVIQQNAEFQRMFAIANGSQAAEQQIQAAEQQKRALDSQEKANEMYRKNESGGRKSMEAWFNAK